MSAMAVGDSRWCSNMGSIGVVEAAVDAVCAESIEDLIAGEAAAPTQAATSPDTSARPTTSPNGPTTAPPTSTS
ncbi:hypothetical protein D2E53_14805 [Mycobacteroides abscessus]|nr:hypothetical protein D2E37_10565 [Mycobacteroides abscessus]RIS82909.1 hypothetical protein D2E53_14805 [Mycobacteroides abscessus]